MEEQIQPPTDKEFQPVLSLSQIPFIERHGISTIIFAVLSLIVVFILYQIIGGIITILIFGLKPTIENIFGYRIATGLGQIIFILVPTLVLIRFASTNQQEFLRLKMPSVPGILVSLVGIFSLQQMLQIYLIYQERIPLPPEVQSIMEKFKEMFEAVYKQLVSTNSIPELLWVIIIVALIPAIAEEFLFRGLVQRSFEKGLTPMRGVIATGLIFGAYHMNPFSFIPLAVIGIYLGFLTMRSGSIWVSVVTHFFNNAFACLALYLNLKDDYVVFGDSESMSTGSLVFTFWFFGVVFLISMFYFLKITKPIQQTETLESFDQ